jgi:hypothetical protein
MAAAKTQLTKNEIMREIVRCGKDPVYFIKNYVKIAHPVKGLIPFTLFKYQEDLVYNLLNHRFNVVLKARQLGISTIASAYALWMILFFMNKEVLCVAIKEKTAGNLIRKTKAMYDHLP